MRKYLSLFVIPQLLIIGFAIYFFLTGNKNIAEFLGYILSPIEMLFVVFYITVWDSRERWPNTSWFERLSYFLTFKQ